MRNRLVSFFSVLIIAVFLVPLFARSAAGVPLIINFQGRLYNSSESLLGGSGTDYCFKFALYDAATAGSKVWPTGAPNPDTLVVRNGVFDAYIGNVDTLDFNFQTTDTVYVDVQVSAKSGTCDVGGTGESYETLDPRPRVVSSGYAINSKTVGGFTPAQSATDSQIPVLTTGGILLGHATTARLASVGTAPLAVDGGASGALNLNNTSTGDILLGGGSGSTGCTLTNSTGAFACAAGFTGTGATLTSANTTQVTTASALSVAGNSLTTGTGIYAASSSLSSGALIDLAITGTAGLTGQKGINVSLSGANATGAQTTYGGYFSNTHTGTSTNVGLYATATGGTNNYAAIFGSGSVGIGTSSPFTALDVLSANGVTDSYGNVFVRTTNSQGINLGGQVSLGGNSTGTSVISTFAAIAGRKENGTSGNGAGYLALATQATSSLIERLRITSTGNVGINQTAPLTFLDVAGNVRTTGKATAVLTGSIDAIASTTVTGVGTLFTTELVIGDRITVTGETRTVTAIATNTSLTVDTAFTDTLNDTTPDVLYALHTAKLSSGAIALAINDLGNVGIGTAAPAQLLDVNGVIRAGIAGANANLFVADPANSAVGIGATNLRYLLAVGGAGDLAYTSAATAANDTAAVIVRPSSIANTSGTGDISMVNISSGTSLNPTGASTWGAGLRVGGPSEGGAGSFTNMASVYIDSAPIGGTNNFALYSTTGTNYFGGNVGINQTSPLTRLDVAGNVRTTGKATAVLTGTIDPAASTTVTGVSTLFTTELVVGDRITVTGETRTVTAIASTTSLTVDVAFSDNANDTTPDVLYALHTARLSSNAIGLVINDLGNLSVGEASSETSARVNLENTISANSATTSIAGVFGNYTFNPSAGGTQVGNRFVVNNAPTTTANTAINQIVRSIDNTTLANLVRGLEVVSNAGSNTAGTNTGIRTTGATFGLQAFTNGLAGGVALPAAIYGESTGTTQGDILRLYSTTMTSAAQMAQFYHNTSTFTGTGLLMSFATGSGTFSGNFIDLQNNSVSKFKVTNAGITSMGLSATASTTAVCSSLANATAPTAGTAYEIRDCNAAPAADYAEMYPVATGMEVGDIVVTGSELVNTYDMTDGNIDWEKVKGRITKLIKSNKAYQTNVIGIISDNTGDFSSTGYNIREEDNPMPVALSGRVPVKISADSPEIAAGDYLTTSSEQGKATKATKAGTVIGKALEPWVGDAGTVMVYVEQGYWNGERLNKLAGLTLPGEENGTTSNMAKAILAKFMSDNGGGVNEELDFSELLTDKLAAAISIVTPSLTANAIDTDTLNAKDAKFAGLTFFDNTEGLENGVTFGGPVEFTMPPTFN